MNSTAQSTVLTTVRNSSTTIGKGITSIPNTTTMGTPFTVPVPAGGSRAQRPDKKLEAAGYGHIRAVRALGRTQIDTNEIANALGLSRMQVHSTLESLKDECNY